MTSMKRKINLPLVERYRPKNFNDIIMDDFMKMKIKKIVKSNKIPNMIITGEPSTGKTSTVHYIIKKLYNENMECILELNASDDRGLAMITSTIIPFCKKKTSNTKLIILDEADSITPKAQNLLNNLINEHKNTTRFIFICNDRFKINESIQSLCMILNFPRIDKKLMKEKIRYICDNESINYTESGLNKLLFYSKYDIRQCINNLECILYTEMDVVDEVVESLIDIPKLEYIKKIILKCKNHELKCALETVTILYNNGYSPNDILLTFMMYILSPDFDIMLDEKIKLTLYKTVSSSYIKINNGVNTIIQLYGCISNIYNLFNE